MNQTQTFIFGIIAGVLVLCTIGFFILLGVMLKGGGLALADNAFANAPTQLPPSAPGVPTPADIRLAAVDAKKEFVRGNKNAKITIVEYSDFDCPFCGRFHSTPQEILKKYDGKVNWVLRHFPLTTIHPNAQKKAHIAECAGDQGKFWEMSDVLFENQGGPVGDSDIKLLAGKVPGLNADKLLACVLAEKFKDKIAADSASAQAAGAQGTPYSIVVGPDGKLIPVNGAQPVEAVESIIQGIL